MTETIEQIAQRLLDARGYLVISSEKIRTPGQVLPRINNATCNLPPIEHQVVVTQETTEQDFLEQLDIIPSAGKSMIPNRHYYRCIAE